MPTLLNTVAHYNAANAILKEPTSTTLTQFLLDCSSLNLPTDVRIDPALPGFSDIARQCSLIISAIHRDRVRQLKTLGLLG